MTVPQTLSRAVGTHRADDAVFRRAADPQAGAEVGPGTLGGGDALLAFFRQVLVDGVFHGDPHGGNLLVGDDGTVCMIDLGLVGRVSPQQRDAMVR